VHHYHRDGQTRFDGNFGRVPNYQPNSFGGPVDDASVKEPPLKISGDADRYDHRTGNDDYTQAGNLYRLMSAEEKVRLVANLVGAMKNVPREIQIRQVRHFYKADPAYGEGVARGLGIDIKSVKTA
jgi:catalase